MKEILLSNGFVYMGKCATCGGMADKYSKRIGSKQALIKVKEQSGTFTLRYAGSATRGNSRNLQNILNRSGLAQVQSI